MKAVVLGSGAWGTALAMALCDNGHDVTLWTHRPETAGLLSEQRVNPKLEGVRLPDTMKFSPDMACVADAELVVSAAPSFAVRETAEKAAAFLRPDAVVVSVSKGIERDTGLRMSQIIRESIGDKCKVAVLSGPSHAEEVSRRLPTGCVAASPAGMGSCSS